MHIVDLAPEHEAAFCVCLEEWSEEMIDAGDLKARWLERMRDRGLIAKLALDDEGRRVGLIQAWPAEHTFVEAPDQYVIGCTWVHGHKQGIGDQRGQGHGPALLAALEEEVRSRGAKGIAAWGLWIPVWMRARWYRRRGYRHADLQGVAQLVHKPLADDAARPRWRRPVKKPARVPGQVTLTALSSGWCPAMNIATERARMVADEFGERVVYERVDTLDRAALAEWGHSDALFVDGRAVRTGPPPSRDKLRKLVARRARKLR